MSFDVRFHARRLCLAALFVGCAGVPTAQAAKCGGTNINNLVSWDQTEIAKGTTLATLRTTSVTHVDDPKSPYHLIAGECIGSFLTGPGGTRAAGVCARMDKDGDVIYEEWSATDGQGNRGISRNVGGTGKFSNSSGSTQWEFSPLQGKMGAVRWSGDCQ